MKARQFDAERATRGGSSASRRNVVLFTALCCASVALAVGYGVHAAVRDGQENQAVGRPAADLAAVRSKPRVLFQRSGGLAVVPLDDPLAAQAPTAFGCDRVDFVQGLGVCLTSRKNIISPSQVIVFDRDFHVVHTLGVPGLPSRVRMSPDGRWAAVTTFVDGHSYAAEFFSTKTVIVDVERGEIVHDLERFTVFRSEQRFSAVDFNFWGVTFTEDSNRFYATLGTSDHRYLVEGNLAAATLKVLRDDVECPSLSPDGRQIAFKRRVRSGIGPVTWRLSVLDLQTMQDTALAETASVDDQAEWLDDDQVLYGIRPGGGATDTWAVPADGSGSPRLFLPGASSAVVVKE